MARTDSTPTPPDPIRLSSSSNTLPTHPPARYAAPDAPPRTPHPDLRAHRPAAQRRRHRRLLARPARDLAPPDQRNKGTSAPAAASKWPQIGQPQRLPPPRHPLVRPRPPHRHRNAAQPRRETPSSPPLASSTNSASPSAASSSETPSPSTTSTAPNSRLSPTARTPPPPSPSTNAACPPALPPHAIRLLPIDPVFPGFLLNTLIYAALPAAVMTASHLRASRRRRQSRCPACGYPLTGLPTCPECGDSSRDEAS
jgi:hypothetical protein